MKNFISSFFFLALASSIFSCGGKDDPETPAPTETAKGKILVNYPWKMTAVKDLNGKTIPPNQLNTLTQALPTMEILFQSGNKVVAKDEALQFPNGGTWYLIENETKLDINITGFAGKFGVEELTSSKMRLKSSMPVNGVDQETIMEFAPVIK